MIKVTIEGDDLKILEFSNDSIPNTELGHMYIRLLQTTLDILNYRYKHGIDKEETIKAREEYTAHKESDTCTQLSLWNWQKE